MRLLNARTYTFHEFDDGELPPFGILSHTWGKHGEVSFQDLRHGLNQKWRCQNGWRKIEHCCRQAQKDSLDFVWVDTCCIDKSSSAELQEAINSMFDWYERSSECYVFLADFEIIQADDAAASVSSGTADISLRGLDNARWFRRGWTLQELLAPASVRFFDAQWREFGSKALLCKQLAEITRISESILVATMMGARQAMSSVSVAQRMSWASNRVTRRIEDTAYCLLGIFDVNMPLLYGEGPKAFQRLQEEIMKISTDQSLLAWGFGCKNSSLWRVSTALAISPAAFAGCNKVVSWGLARPGDSFSMTQRGLSLHLPVVSSLDGGNLIYFALNCTTEDKIPPGGDARAARVMAIPFKRLRTWGADKVYPHPDEYYPLSARMPLWVEREDMNTGETLRAFLPRIFRHGPATYHKLRVALNLENMPENWFVGGVFPPEKSDNDFLVIHPWSQSQEADILPFPCYFIVHFANSSPKVSGIIVVLEFDGVDETEHFKSTKSSLISFYDLKKNVLSIIADVAGVDVEEISAETQLETLGLDFVMSMEIVSGLRKMLDAWISSSDFFQSKNIGDLFGKLQFVAKPPFGLLKETVGGINGRDDSSVPRLHVTNARFCVIQVEGSFSLVQLSEDAGAGFRDRLSFTEADTPMIELQTPVDEIELLLDLTMYPFSLRFDTRAVRNTTTGMGTSREDESDSLK